MFSSRTLVPLFVYLSLLLSFTGAHDVPLLKRDHAGLNVKRLMKKRSPLPDLGLPDFGQVAGAGAVPTVTSASSSSATSASSSAASSSSSTSSLSSTSASLSATSSSASSSSSVSSSSSTASSSSSSSSSSTSSSSKSAAPTPTLNLTNAPALVSTVTPTFTHTATANAAAQDTSIPAPLSGVAKTKSTTFTVLIAIAASVGGVFILWTVFRKWKLSSSKKFDDRLRPIDWQPTTGEDDVIPTHRRVPSGSSFHSAGHSSNNGTGRNPGFTPLEHDFTVGPTHVNNIGGYADLARASSPNPAMQELARGPSFNRGYDQGVPLHHLSGYGNPRY